MRALLDVNVLIVLALTVKQGGRLVTLNRGVPLAAVSGPGIWSCCRNPQARASWGSFVTPTYRANGCPQLLCLGEATCSILYRSM